jgi:hypothetical protein
MTLAFTLFLASLAWFHASEAGCAFAFNPEDAGWKSACAAPEHTTTSMLPLTDGQHPMLVCCARLADYVAVCRCHVTGMRGVCRGRLPVAAGRGAAAQTVLCLCVRG